MKENPLPVKDLGDLLAKREESLVPTGKEIKEEEFWIRIMQLRNFWTEQLDSHNEKARQAANFVNILYREAAHVHEGKSLGLKVKYFLDEQSGGVFTLIRGRESMGFIPPVEKGEK